MNRSRRCRSCLAATFAVATLGAAAVTPAAAQPMSAQPAGEGAITQVAVHRLSPRLIEFTLRTTALAADTHVRVLLPVDYDRHPDLRYPVIYMLHGGNDDYTSWTRPGGGNAIAATAKLPVIVVMPDAGLGGWYTDWFTTGAKGQPRWETYHVGELIPWVDQHLRTIASRNGRAILGLSMGGFGAMSYAAQHPDTFIAAGSFSGAVDTNTPPTVASHVIDQISSLDGGLPGSLWGLRENNEIRWRGANPWDLAGNLRGMTLVARTGDGNTGGQYGGGGPTDGGTYLEVLVHLETVSFHHQLAALNIKHTYDAYKGGTHSWPYWNDDLNKTLPLLMATFAHPPRPQPFTYTSIQSNYSVYGWNVVLDRPALEFSTISNTGPSGFTLSGSGTARIATSANYVPGAGYKVIMRGAGSSSTSTLTATRTGQLIITVPLGPANPVQEQFTPGTTRTPVDTKSYATTVSIPATAPQPSAAVSPTPPLARSVRSANTRTSMLAQTGISSAIPWGAMTLLVLGLSGGLARRLNPPRWQYRPKSGLE